MCRVGGVADLQAARSSLGQSIETRGEQGTGETATLVRILDSHRLHHPDTGDGVEPEERVASDLCVGSLDGEIDAGS